MRSDPMFGGGGGTYGMIDGTLLYCFGLLPGGWWVRAPFAFSCFILNFFPAKVCNWGKLLMVAKYSIFNSHLTARHSSSFTVNTNFHQCGRKNYHLQVFLQVTYHPVLKIYCSSLINSGFNSWNFLLNRTMGTVHQEYKKGSHQHLLARRVGQ